MVVTERPMICDNLAKIDAAGGESYRAAYWISDCTQHEIVLTTRKEAHLSDADLLAVGREHAFFELSSGDIVVGDWTD